MIIKGKGKKNISIRGGEMQNKTMVVGLGSHRQCSKLTYCCQPCPMGSAPNSRLWQNWVEVLSPPTTPLYVHHPPPLPLLHCLQQLVDKIKERRKRKWLLLWQLRFFKNDKRKNFFFANPLPNQYQLRYFNIKP
jgi:hypothetical protein